MVVVGACKVLCDGLKNRRRINEELRYFGAQRSAGVITVRSSRIERSRVQYVLYCAIYIEV